MSKKLTRRSNVRDPTPRNLRTITLQSPGVVVPAGYMRLLDSPEIGACIDRMVSLIATLPIYLMRNSELGDVRVRCAEPPGGCAPVAVRDAARLDRLGAHHAAG